MNYPNGQEAISRQEASLVRKPSQLGLFGQEALSIRGYLWTRGPLSQGLLWTGGGPLSQQGSLARRPSESFGLSG